MFYQVDLPMHPVQVQKTQVVANNSATHNVEQMPSFTSAKVSSATLKAYTNKVSFGSNFSVEYKNTTGLDKLMERYGAAMISDVKDVQERHRIPGQFLGWIGTLLETQVKQVDNIYDTANELKVRGGKGKIGIIGIGGSRHTAESMLTLFGLQDKASFLAAVDPESVKRFVKDLGDIKEANIMVVSKSGGTLEPNDGYAQVKKIFVDEYAKRIAQEEGLSPDAAKAKAEQEVKNHIVIVTDKNPAKSQLRRQVGEGDLSGVIHDDCGGRFGAFDDHVLLSLAYAGLPKDDMKRMLNAAQNAQKKFLSTDLTKNEAAQKSMFNVDQIKSGKSNSFNYYFGDMFDKTTLWSTQLARESHKAAYFPTESVGPAFLHYAAESDLDENNKTSFYNFITVDNKGADYKTYNAIVSGVVKAYSDMHPVSHIKLKDLSPESIAEFVEMKHFETLYTGMLLRSLEGKAHPPKDGKAILPEVDQPNVEKYKIEVKKFLN